MLATSTEQTVDVWLPEHDDTPPDQRPTFVYRFISTNAYLRRQRLRTEVFGHVTDEESFAKLHECLSIGLVGWRNVVGDEGQPVPYVEGSIAGLGELRWGDKLRLYDRVVSMADLGDTDRKKSPPSSGSEPAPSATSASTPASA